MSPFRSLQVRQGRSLRSIAAHLVFYAAYGAVLAGFLFHRSENPIVLGYSANYLLLLVILATPLAIPTLARRAARKFGARNVAFVLAPSLLVVCSLYVAGHLYYDYSREYRFDPYLQMPSQVLEEQYPAARADSGFRILALGGSTTRGFLLSRANAYPSVLERVLRQRTGRDDIQVINAGQDWYTAKHSLINYVTYARAWKPDLVIVMHAVNDVGRAFSPPDFSIGAYDDHYRHYFAQASDAARAPTFEQYVERNYLRWLTDSWFSSIRIRERDFPISFYRSITPFRDHLNALVTYAQTDGAEVMFVTQPFLYRQSMPPEELAVLYRAVEMSERTGLLARSYASTASLGRAMAAFNATAQEVATERGALFVDAANAIPRDLRHHVDEVHFTEAGARRLATTIAEAIIEAGVRDRRLDQ